MSAVLKIFIDESGNFDFSPGGTRYFVLSAVSTLGCADLGKELHELKHALAAGGDDRQRFHATEDLQSVRDAVFTILEDHTKHECFNVDAVVVQKNKTNPRIRELETFYPRILKILLQYILRRWEGGSPRRIVVWTDQIGHKRKRRVVEKAIKTYLANELRVRLPYHLYHHSSASEWWLQAADYCGWSVYKKWTDGETRPFARIAQRVSSQFDVFAQGSTMYY